VRTCLEGKQPDIAITFPARQAETMFIVIYCRMSCQVKDPILAGLSQEQLEQILHEGSKFDSHYTNFLFLLVKLTFRNSVPYPFCWKIQLSFLYP
jgi:hypothetical protein